MKLSRIAIAKKAAKKAKSRLHNKGFPYVIAIDKEVYLKYPKGKIVKAEQ